MGGRKQQAAGLAPEAGTGEAAAEELGVNDRGEISVELDGQDYVLRPSRAAISKVEERTRPLLALTQAAMTGALTIDEMAVCVTEMMHAYGTANPEDELAPDYKGAKVERIADLIFEASSYKICARLWVVLSGALYGGYTASGEAKAAKTTA